MMNDHTNHIIAELNDKGASLLVQGRHQEAIAAFRQCSGVIKSVCAVADSLRNGAPPSNASYSPERQSPQVFSSETMVGLQHEEFFIYNRPYLLSNVVRLLSASSAANLDAIMRVCSASTVFNIALSFHLRAMQGSREAVDCAERLYLSALELLMGDDECDVISADEIFLLAIAAANNISHIRIMNEGAASSTAVASLSLLQNCLLPTLTRGERLKCVPQCEWESICRNMHALSRTKSAISAPAA